MKEIAERFGHSLDQDDFVTTRSLLSPDCEYSIGRERLLGPAEITKSYEENMLEGRNKLDKLIWGKSWVEPVSKFEFYVHFTDYLVHNGQNHTHRCKQKLSIENGLIVRIEHIHDEAEQGRLDSFYQLVGLK